MALCRFSLRVDEVGAGIHRVIIVPLAEIQSGPLRERNSADARNRAAKRRHRILVSAVHPGDDNGGVRVSWRDDPGVGNSKRILRDDIAGIGGSQGCRVAKINGDRRWPAGAVALRAIRVQAGARSP